MDSLKELGCSFIKVLGDEVYGDGCDGVYVEGADFVEGVELVAFGDDGSVLSEVLDVLFDGL